MAQKYIFIAIPFYLNIVRKISHVNKAFNRLILSLFSRIFFDEVCFITEKENWIRKQIGRIDEAIR